MAKVIKSICFTKEEKEILIKAKNILKDVYDEIEKEDSITGYENSEYITDILDIPIDH